MAIGSNAVNCGMIREMTDLLMPRECLVCGRQLGAREDFLCLWCAADMPLTFYWERWHNPMADQFNALLERQRPEGESLEYAGAAALLFYHHENPYKRIPQALKYEGQRAAGAWFGRRLGRFMAENPAWAEVDTVLPIPLHWWRKWRRGYNQAEVLASALAESLGARLCTDALIRVRRTRSQVRLDADERLKNVEGAFVLRYGFPSRHVLIVDDTFTTGATLSAAYWAVRRALGGEVKVSVATLAVVEA